MSSAYSSILTVPSDVSTPAFNFLISVARSLRKTEKRVGDRLSPYFTPKDVGNQFVNRPPGSFTHASVFIYKDLIAENTLPSTP